MHNRICLDGKRVLVVGCYSGMGQAAAKIVQSWGAAVHGFDYKEPDYPLDGFTQVDLRDRAAIEGALERLGPVDRLLYCAGLPQTFPFEEIVAVNLAAMRHVVDAVTSTMPADGAVAIISSNGGLQFMDRLPVHLELLATPDYEDIVAWCDEHRDLVGDPYTFSKEAIIVYTMQKAFASAESGIRVNCISPGPTATPMMPEFEKAAGADLIRAFEGPFHRKAQPEEQAWPLAFLITEAASYITGVNLVIDGGFLAGVMTGAVDVAALMAEGLTRVAAGPSTVAQP